MSTKKINPLTSCNVDVVACCPHKGGHRATNSSNGATQQGNTEATVDWDSLIDGALEGNTKGNSKATNPRKQGNKCRVNLLPPQKACNTCDHKEHIEPIVNGCNHIIASDYPNQWSLLDSLEQCPRDYRN